jgi:hypothetical protein
VSVDGARVLHKREVIEMFKVMRRMRTADGRMSDKFFNDTKTLDKAKAILEKEQNRLQDNYIFGIIRDEQYNIIYQK